MDRFWNTTAAERTVRHANNLRIIKVPWDLKLLGSQKCSSSDRSLERHMVLSIAWPWTSTHRHISRGEKCCRSLANHPWWFDQRVNANKTHESLVNHHGWFAKRQQVNQSNLVFTNHHGWFVEYPTVSRSYLSASGVNYQCWSMVMLRVLSFCHQP